MKRKLTSSMRTLHAFDDPSSMIPNAKITQLILYLEIPMQHSSIVEVFHSNGYLVYLKNRGFSQAMRPTFEDHTICK